MCTHEDDSYSTELNKGRKLGILKSFYSAFGLGLTNFIILGTYGLGFW